jgi:hypothetical protein
MPQIEAKSLRQSWVDAFRDGGGPDLLAEDVATSMCYRADVLYERPLPDTPAVMESEEEADFMAVEVVDEANWGRWRHSIGKYLRRPLLRKALVELLEL